MWKERYANFNVIVAAPIHVNIMEIENSYIKE